ncbi:hypothetical protein AcW1_000720 [Taiwanofungus camphoratus]|nr:hypothetical protein AcW1_000720 [Antrodia cinnamomea]
MNPNLCPPATSADNPVASSADSSASLADLLNMLAQASTMSQNTNILQSTPAQGTNLPNAVDMGSMMPRQNSSLPIQGGSFSQQLATLVKSTMGQQDGMISQKSGTIPHQNDMVSQQVNMAPQQGGMMSQQAGMMSQQAGVIPQQDGLVFKQGDIAIQQTGSMLTQSPAGLAMIQGLINDALKMSIPVGNCLDDETRLVRALHDSEGKGQTYRQALEALHGINNHSANAWKDYYLEHIKRINKLVVNLRPSVNSEKDSPMSVATSTTAGITIGQPSALEHSPSSASSHRLYRHHEYSHSHASSSSKHASSQKSLNYIQKKLLPDIRSREAQRFYDDDRFGTSSAKHLHTSSHQDESLSHERPQNQKSKKRSKGKRKNALWDEAGFVSLYPINALVRIPDPPSRSPTPPTRVVPRGKGNRFTKEDHEFFIKFIQWELQKDPNMNRSQLCRMLAEKTPHHSEMAWSAYWNRNHDLADKIYVAAGVEDASSDDQGSSDESSNESDSSDDYEESGDDDSIGQSDPGTEDDIRNMGISGEAFGAADFRVMARYIASKPNWEHMGRGERWNTYTSMYRSRRSVESYAQAYQRFGKIIDRLVRKYQRKAEAAKSDGLNLSSGVVRKDAPPGSRPQKRRASDLHLLTVGYQDKRPKTDGAT